MNPEQQKPNTKLTMITKTFRRCVLFLVSFTVSLTLAQENSPSTAPKELAHLKIPTGTHFRITAADQPVEKEDELSIRVNYSKLSDTTVQPDGLAVIYFTPIVQLDGDPGSFQSAQGIINVWRKNADLLEQSVPTKVTSPAGDVAGGVAVLKYSKDNPSFGMSGFGVPLKGLKPQVLGLILITKGKPLSNIFWLRLAEHK